MSKSGRPSKLETNFFCSEIRIVSRAEEFVEAMTKNLFGQGANKVSIDAFIALEKEVSLYNDLEKQVDWKAVRRCTELGMANRYVANQSRVFIETYNTNLDANECHRVALAALRLAIEFSKHVRDEAWRQMRAKERKV
jgi:hypothetical protein